MNIYEAIGRWWLSVCNVKGTSTQNALGSLSYSVTVPERVRFEHYEFHLEARRPSSGA